MKRKIKADALKVPAADTDVKLVNALDEAFKGFNLTTPNSCINQDKTQKRLDTRIRVLAKQLLINQWFTAFNLFVSILLALKLYGFGG